MKTIWKIQVFVLVLGLSAVTNTFVHVLGRCCTLDAGALIYSGSMPIGFPAKCAEA